MSTIKDTRGRGKKVATEESENKSDEKVTKKSKTHNPEKASFAYCNLVPAIMQEYDINKSHRWIEPGPVVMVVTSQDSKPNVMTIGFHMCIQHEPPLLGIILGPWDHSFSTLQATGECVIAVPGVDLASTVVDIGNCSGDEVDKFQKFKLNTKPAAEVQPPLITDCLANFECKVKDKSKVKSYNLWILEVVKVLIISHELAWVNPSRSEKRMFHHRGDGTFVIDGEILNLQERMVKWKEYQD